MEKRDDADEFVRQKLTLRWATPGGRWPEPQDEEGAERLARAVDAILSPSGLGEVNGFELGAGCVDVLIFGRETPSDTDRIYRLLAPIFEGFGCPPGSAMIRRD